MSRPDHVCSIDIDIEAFNKFKLIYEVVSRPYTLIYRTISWIWLDFRNE